MAHQRRTSSVIDCRIKFTIQQPFHVTHFLAHFISHIQLQLHVQHPTKLSPSRRRKKSLRNVRPSLIGFLNHLWNWFRVVKHLFPVVRKPKTERKSNKNASLIYCDVFVFLWVSCRESIFDATRKTLHRLWIFSLNWVHAREDTKNVHADRMGRMAVANGRTRVDDDCIAEYARAVRVQNIALKSIYLLFITILFYFKLNAEIDCISLPVRDCRWPHQCCAAPICARARAHQHHWHHHSTIGATIYLAHYCTQFERGT